MMENIILQEEILVSKPRACALIMPLLLWSYAISRNVALNSACFSIMTFAALPLLVQRVWDKLLRFTEFGLKEGVGLFDISGAVSFF